MSAPTVFDRRPPQDIEAELATLGAMLLNEDAVDTVVNMLGETSDPFFTQAHQCIYDAMLAIRKAGKPIDLVILMEEMQRSGTLDKAGGISYIAGLEQATPTSANAEYYAGIVKAAYTRRYGIQIFTKAVGELYKADCDTPATIAQIEHEIFKITEGNIGGKCAPVTDFLDDERAKLQHLLDGGELTGLRTGLASLDRILRPMSPGDYIIVAARPSVGKTTFTANIAYNVMKSSKVPVLFISLEMSAGSITKKFISIAGSVNIRAIETKKCIDRVAIQGLAKGCKELEAMPLYIDDEAGITGMQLRAKVKAAKKNHCVELVIVDYIGLMNDPSQESDNIRLTNISRAIKTAAKESRVPIIVLSQFNREADKDGGAKMSHLRGSGAIEQDADMVIALAKKIGENGQELVYCDVQKQREGETGGVDLMFHKQVQKFACVGYEPEPVEDDGYVGDMVENEYEETYDGVPF